MVTETDSLSRLDIDVEAVAEVENSELCESRELADSDAEGEIDPSCEMELLRDGISIVFEAFTDAETVVVPPNLFVGEITALTVCDRDTSDVFVAISEVVN